MSECILA